MGMIHLNLVYNKKHSRQDVYVIRDLRHELLGKPAIENLGLLERVCSAAAVHTRPELAYPQLFQGLGTLKGDYCLRIRRDATPFAVTSPRRVPLPLYARTRDELQEMERLGVISRVQEPTDWCAPMIVVQKKTGGVRICVDLTELNRFVLRE